MEIFKDINGYENIYQVSNYGRVKSLKREVKMPMGGVRVYPMAILSPRVGSHGYKYINLKSKSYTIHRLVASAFLDNPNNYKCVGHKDDNKTNNQVYNLEWCSHSQNNKRAYDTGLKCGSYKGVIGKDNPSSKKVFQYTLDGKLIKTWDSQADIKRALGYSQGNISSCCNGRQKTYKGFKWQS